MIPMDPSILGNTLLMDEYKKSRHVVAVNLKRMRICTHIDLESLAKKSGVPEEMIRWIEGENTDFDPTMHDLCCLAEALNCPFIMLLPFFSDEQLADMSSDDIDALILHREKV